jgi:hypothetical protein
MSGAGNHAPCSVAPVIGTPGRAESDLRLLGGLLGESAHIRGKLSSGLLEQIGRAQNEGEVRTIPKLLSAEVAPLKSIKGALSKASPRGERQRSSSEVLMAITRPLEGAQAEPKGRGNECEERAAGAALKGFPWVPKATPRVSGGVQCDSATGRHRA